MSHVYPVVPPPPWAPSPAPGHAPWGRHGVPACCAQAAGPASGWDTWSAPRSTPAAAGAGRLAARFAAALWLATVLGVLALIVGTRALAGWTAYDVVSGSMDPAMHIGDIVLVEPRQPGMPFAAPTIITFRGEDGQLITHRVHDAVRADDGEVVYTTKGDANPGPDTDLVPHSDVVGSVRMVLRGAALPRHWMAAGRPGPVLLIALVTLGSLRALLRRRVRR